MLVAVAGFGGSATNPRECRDRLCYSSGGKICTRNAAMLSWTEHATTTRCSMAATTQAALRTKLRQCQTAPKGMLKSHKIMSCSKNSGSLPVGKFGQSVICTVRDVEQPRSDPWQFVPIVTHQHINLPSSRRPCRILCYGDSNTAGYTDQGRSYNPYGETLSETLRVGGAVCDVGVCGINGHTAKQMTKALSDRCFVDTHGRGGKGLGRILDEDGPIDLVIIMTGTNDLARGAHPWDTVNDVTLLHSACHERGVPTIALAPPFGVTLQRGHKSVHMRNRLASLLGKHLESKEGLLAFFDAEELVPQHCSEYWCDAIHFSAAGHRMLGRCLAEWLLPVLQTAKLEDGVPINPARKAEVVDVMPVAGDASRYPPTTPRAARARSVSPSARAMSPSASRVSVAAVSRARAFENHRSSSRDNPTEKRSRSVPPSDGQHAQQALSTSATRMVAPQMILSETIRQLEPADRSVYVARSLSVEPRRAREESSAAEPRRAREDSSADEAQAQVSRDESPSPRPRASKDGTTERLSYRVGDAVEVWSNSQQVWCAGRVKKVDGNRVTSEFLLPDNGPAKKILSMKSRELRHA